MRRAAFPGSFDPLTLAHVGIAEAARDQLGLDGVDLVISRIALAKDPGRQRPVARRVADIRAAIGPTHPWLDVVVTDQQLLVDIALGYDALVVGADKWHQLVDVSFYGTETARDDAVSRLPLVAIAPRAGIPFPDVVGGVVHLDVPADLHEISSTAVREGRHDWRA